MKNLKIKKNYKIKNKIENFCKKTSPTRHINSKVINFAPINKSIMAYKLP